MANIIDYMDWRGDISFEASPVNEVDGLIFSQFSYVVFDEFFKNNRNLKITVKELADKYFALHSEEEINGYTELLINCSKVLKKMAETERFGRLQVMDYVSDFDPENNKQFSAVTVKIKNGEYYVAFRGTDDSLAGWEEDFQACYMMPVAAQVEAGIYLADFFKKHKGKAYIGGHSKGGNLAVYAAMVEGSKQKDRVIRVQNYDGPGFLQEFVDSKEYQTMVELVDNYNPKASIVGMIMFRDDSNSIVESSEKGLMQHTGISWQVMGTHFVTSDSFENMSLVFNNANKNLINEIDKEERAVLIEIVFKILRNDFDTVTGLKEGFFNTASSILKSYNDLDKDVRKIVRRIIGQVIKISKDSYKETKKEIKSINDGL